MSNNESWMTFQSYQKNVCRFKKMLVHSGITGGHLYHHRSIFISEVSSCLPGCCWCEACGWCWSLPPPPLTRLLSGEVYSYRQSQLLRSSNLAVNVAADGGDEHIGVESGGGWLLGVDGEGWEVRSLSVPHGALQEGRRGGADGGGALLQHPPPVVEWHEEDHGDQEDGRHEAPDDHSEQLRPSLLVLDFGLRQQLDRLQLGDHGDVNGVAGPELVPDLYLDSVGCSWNRESSFTIEVNQQVLTRTEAGYGEVRPVGEVRADRGHHPTVQHLSGLC